MGPISKRLSNVDGKEVRQQAVQGAALGALGEGLRAATRGNQAMDNLYKSLGTLEAARGNEAFRPPVSTLKGLGRAAGKGALASAVATPAAYVAMQQLPDWSGKEESGEDNPMLESAALGATAGATGVGGGLMAGKAIRNADILQTLGRSPSKSSLGRDQLRRLGKMMSNPRILRYAGGAGLLGGLAGLGYSALRGDEPKHKKKNEVDNTAPPPEKRTKEYGDRGLDNTIPNDTSEMGPRVRPSDPTSYSY